MTGVLSLDAFLFGLISAAALPLGALLAFKWTPKPKVLAAMMAMGAGALLAALTMDMVAESMAHGHFYPLAVGMIIGGVFFAVLNSLVNGHGGFLRKTATTLTHLTRKHNHRQKLLFGRLSKIGLFRSIPPSQVHHLIPYLHRFHYRAGKMMVHEGDPGDMFYIIESGSAIIMDDATNNIVSLLSANQTYGLAELLTEKSHVYTVVVKEDMHVWIINKESLDVVLRMNPILAEELKNLVRKDLLSPDIKNEHDREKAERWYSEALNHFPGSRNGFDETEVHTEVKEHSNASLAIWLGILLDGIPESIVIGASLLLDKTMSLSLLVGLFLSNFPEALSSSVGMRKQKMPHMKIFLMWFSIMLLTGVGAYCGNVFFDNVSPGTYALVDGMAAGAMLTMIAQTMLPEAFHIGGSVTGLSALAGFLATLFSRMLG
jgi:zinc transporter ZupT